MPTPSYPTTSSVTYPIPPEKIGSTFNKYITTLEKTLPTFSGG